MMSGSSLGHRHSQHKRMFSTLNCEFYLFTPETERTILFAWIFWSFFHSFVRSLHWNKEKKAHKFVCWTVFFCSCILYSLISSWICVQNFKNETTTKKKKKHGRETLLTRDENITYQFLREKMESDGSCACVRGAEKIGGAGRGKESGWLIERERE